MKCPICESLPKTNAKDEEYCPVCSSPASDGLSGFLVPIMPSPENQIQDRYDLIEREFEKRTQELTDHLDLMVDEFARIKACCRNFTTLESAAFASEIVGLCERAITRTRQLVPVITQRDELSHKLDVLKLTNAGHMEELQNSKEANKEMGDALERIAAHLGLTHDTASQIADYIELQ